MQFHKASGTVVTAMLAASLATTPALAQSGSNTGQDQGRQIAVLGNGQGATGCVACHSTDDEFGKMVLVGAEVFVQTQEYARDGAGNDLDCVICHLDPGASSRIRADGSGLYRVPEVPLQEQDGQHQRGAYPGLFPS